MRIRDLLFINWFIFLWCGFSRSFRIFRIFLGRGRVDRICQYLLEILTNRLNLPGGYSVS